jgi:hypothetical protein
MDLQHQVGQQQRLPESRKSYRGMSVNIRRLINSGEVTGKLTPVKLRKHLPGDLCQAPNKVIWKSLEYMAKNNDIQAAGKKDFFPNDFDLSPKKPQVIVTGELLDTESRNGKLVVTIEVDSMEAQSE